MIKPIIDPAILNGLHVQLLLQVGLQVLYIQPASGLPIAIILGVVSGISDELHLTVMTHIPILKDSEFGDFDPDAFEKRSLLIMIMKPTSKSSNWWHNCFDVCRQHCMELWITTTG